MYDDTPTGTERPPSDPDAGRLDAPSHGRSRARLAQDNRPSFPMSLRAPEEGRFDRPV